MLDRPGLDFSFSGLKTAAIVKHRNWQAAHSGDELAAGKWMRDLAASFEEAVVDTLVRKCVRALEATGHDTLVISGGVSANQRLRQRVDALSKQRSLQSFYPALEFCTDNGAMIALAGAYRMAAGMQDETSTVRVRARWPLYELSPLNKS